jgi:GTPase SAR1 family protein
MNEFTKQDDCIHISVVGHTNTGKTSLLRTLTRDDSFGHVEDAPGTTREVHAVGVKLGSQTVLWWHDTPGLEDSGGLRDWIEGLQQNRKRLDGPDRIKLFLQDRQAQIHFEQERRVLSQVMQSDAMLYVVDVRDPVLAKHRDELYLLQSCARPVLPVLNFTAHGQSDLSPWLEVFARNGIHITLSFDTISPPINGEQVMFETLAQLLAQHRPLLLDLAKQAQQQREHRLVAAVEMLADLCLDVACNYRQAVNESDALVNAQQDFEDDLRNKEHSFVLRLLKLYRFSELDYIPQAIGFSAGQWSTDLFSGQAISDVGLELGKGAVVGAAAGAAFDIMTVGLSLGAGTLIGAAAGSVWQGWEQMGKGLMARARGQRVLLASHAVLLVVALRNLQLIAALEQRGHASQTPLRLQSRIHDEQLDRRAVLEVLLKARMRVRTTSNEQWQDDPRYAQAREKLQRILRSSLILPNSNGDRVQFT